MTNMLEDPPSLAGKPVKEKSFSGSIPRNGNGITPAANTTGGNTQDQEKITSADISKKRKMKDVDEEANDQELSCRSGSKLRKWGGRHGNLGHEYLAESSDDIRKNQMKICTEEDRMALDSSSEGLEEGVDAKTVPPAGILKIVDCEKTWGLDRLLPLMNPIWWSDYLNYLRQYYKCNASVVAEVTGSLVASANVCLKKEEELVSLWKTCVYSSPIRILPVYTLVQSNLIQKHARSIIFAEEGELPVASSVAFACISKEADLICELLKHGAKPTDGIIQQSSVIRMCALSLMLLQGLRDIDADAAAAAMVGITKECKLMCDWIKKEDKLITLGPSMTSFFTHHELEECRLIRIRTMDVMLSILKASSFPSSKMWLELVLNN